MLSYRDIFNLGKPITKIVDPYSYLAVKKNLKNYKMFTLSSFLPEYKRYNEELKSGDIPCLIIDHIAENGEVLCIGNPLPNNQSETLIFRDIKEKKFLTVGNMRNLPYNYCNLSNNFKYGDLLVIVEGMKDCDSLRNVYPNVIANMRASLSGFGRELVKTLTNNFLLLYDKDETGDKSVIKDSKYLIESGNRVNGFNNFNYYQIKNYLRHPLGVKDCGEITDLAYKNKSFESEFLETYYLNLIKTLI